MNVKRPQTATLAPAFLLIGCLPVIIICGTDWILNLAGPVLPSPLRLDPAAANAYLELAARLRVATAYIALISAAVVATAYFVVVIRDADRRTIVRTLGAAALSIIVVFAYFKLAKDPQTQQLVGQSLFCEAASWPGNAVPPSPGLKAFPADPMACQAERFAFIRERIDTQRYGLALAIPAVVFGAILSLRRRRPSLDGDAQAEDEAEARHLQVQINRLNTILYLTAFLLVSGLLFLGAFLHYPGFALPTAAAASFGKAVQAIVLYYAVSYSLLIASFYLPVAGILAHRCEAMKQAKAAEESKSGIMAPIQMVKVAFAILSPLLAGLASEIVKLPGA